MTAKLLLAANVFFTLGLVLDLLALYGFLPAWDWGKLIKALFLVFFTLGIYELRSLVIDLERHDRHD